MQIKQLIILAAIFGLINSCSCGGKTAPTPTPPPVQEAQIAFSLSPYTANTVNQVAGASAQETVTITSTMPGKGVTITITVTDLTNNANIAQNAPVTNSNATNNITIINLPSQHLCTVKITITSVATSTNTVSLSFTLANKQ